MAELLILAQPRTVDDPELQFATGDVVQVRPDGYGWSVGEAPPMFVVLKVPGVTVEAVQQYAYGWMFSPVFSGVDHDLVTDTYTFTLTAPYPGAAQEAGVTAVKVEAALTSWGAVVTGTGPNSVSVSASIYDVATSPAFWDLDEIVGIQFVELTYVQGTGVHRIGLDYSGSPYKAQAIADRIIRRGGTIISHNAVTKQGAFEIGRDTVREEFKFWCQDKMRQTFRPSRFAFAPADVALALSLGGTVTLTPAQAAAKLVDKAA